MPATSFVARGAPFVLASALCGCGIGGRALPSAGNAALEFSANGSGKISHIVYVVQENRSFDDLFQGYPGADTVSAGKDSKGRTVTLQPLGLGRAYSLDHSVAAMVDDCNGAGSLPGTQCRMNGFDKEESGGAPRRLKYPAYVYVPHSDTRPYFAMAHQWVLADRMFQSQLDESFVAHQYIVAAQAAASMDLPSGFWGCAGGRADLIYTITKRRRTGPQERACFDYRTLGDELDDAKRSWRFYTSKYGSPSSGQGGFWSSYQAVRHIYYGADWKKDIVTPQQRFLTDVAAGHLADFTWITPVCANSDHLSCGGGYGPSWVTALVNAVGESKFWNTTAIFVQWDDWGGLYDHVPPPYRGFDGLGFRVPLLVISPYAKKNYVSHEQYETASVLRFAEDLFGLPQLADADWRAKSPADDCFDFAQAPRAFVPIKAPKGRDFFLRQPPDYRIPDYE